MSIIKPELDDIEKKGPLLALWSILILVCIFGIITIEIPSLETLTIAVIASLISVLITVYFVNYKSTKDRQKFRKMYLIKISPIFKRLFARMYSSSKKLVNLENSNIRMEEYTTILNNYNNLILNKKRLQEKKNIIPLDELFNKHRQNLIHFSTINSSFLPPNLTLNISEIIERLYSLSLQIKLNNDGEVLKDIKAIFKHLRIIDSKILKLNLDQ